MLVQYSDNDPEAYQVSADELVLVVVCEAPKAISVLQIARRSNNSGLNAKTENILDAYACNLLTSCFHFGFEGEI